MIKDMREKHKNVLLLDCGDVFSKTKDLSELRAKISMRGLGLMKYDALNVADSDLVFGWDFLQGAAQKTSVPLVSGNVIKQNLNQPLVQQYLVKEFDEFTAGIIGLASSDYFNKESLIKEGLVITDPEETLKRILSEIQEKVDIVILLSHLGFTATKEMVQKIDGIDVAIAGHGKLSMENPELVGETLVVQNSFEGRYLGILALTLDQDGSIAAYQGTKAKLPKDIPDEPEVAALVETFKKEKLAFNRAKREEKRKRLLMHQQKDALRMSPEEFIAQMKETNRLMTPEEFKEQVRKRSTPPENGA
jgi:2',3'-cyclic-nucleotide 2'-phosphodiesterase (5'-nucleotidase family)